MNIKSSIYASFAPEDTDYVQRVLEVMRSSGYTVHENSGSVHQKGAVHLLFLSDAYVSSPVCSQFLEQIVLSDELFALIRLDDCSADPNTEMVLHRYQALYAKDFDSAEQLGQTVAETMDMEKDPEIALYKGEGNYLFISYSHAENQLIHAVAKELSSRNVNFWYDRNLLLGDIWSKEIAQHVQGSRSFLAFVSRQFAESVNCKAEINLAASSDVESPVTVVRMQGATLDDGIEMYIKAGGTVLRYEQYKNVSSLVDAIVGSEDVKECIATEPDLSPVSVPLFRFPSPAVPFLRRKTETAEQKALSELSLYPAHLQIEKPVSKPLQKKKLAQLERIAENICAAYGKDELIRFDRTLSARTEGLKQRWASGEKQDTIIPDAFICVMEAVRRANGLSLPSSSLVCGLVMCQDDIAVTSDPEYRQYSLLFAAYLRSLSGKSVHIITTWEYDVPKLEQELRPACRILGLSLGTVTKGMPWEKRKEQYDSDVTVVSISQLAFDYLRDHTTKSTKDLLLSGLHTALMFDADSLICEYHTDTVILTVDNQRPQRPTLYPICSLLARNLTRDADYTVEGHSVQLTKQGIRKVEAFLADELNTNTDILIYQNCLNNILKARELMVKGKDYAVRDGRILPIDMETGTIADNRNFPNGMRHALEIKEHLSLSRDRKKAAEIVVRNLIHSYSNQAGLARIAFEKQKNLTESWAFSFIKVGSFASERIRQEKVYFTRRTKLSYIYCDAVDNAKEGRAVIIGTPYWQDFIDLRRLFAGLASETDLVNILTPESSDEDAVRVLGSAGHAGHITLISGSSTRGVAIAPDRLCTESGGILVFASSYFRTEAKDEQLLTLSGQCEPSKTVTYVSLDDPYVKEYVDQDRIRSVQDSLSRLFEDVEETELTANTLLRTMHRQRRKALEVDHKLQKISNTLRDINDSYRDVFFRDRERVLQGDHLDELYEEIIRRSVLETAEKIPLIKDLQMEWRTKVFWGFTWLPHKHMQKMCYVDNFPQDPEQLAEIIINILLDDYQSRKQVLQDLDRGSDGVAEFFSKKVILDHMDDTWISVLRKLEELEGTDKTYKQLQEYLPTYKEQSLEYLRNRFGSMRQNIIYDFFVKQIRRREPDVQESQDTAPEQE